MALYEGDISLEGHTSVTVEPSLISSGSTSLSVQTAAQGFFPGSSFRQLIGWWSADDLAGSSLTGSLLEQWEDLSITGNDLFKTEDFSRPVLKRDNQNALDYFDFGQALLETQGSYPLENVLPVSLVFLARFPNAGSVETFWSFVENVQAGVQKDGISVDVAIVSNNRVQVHYGNQDINTFFGSDFSRNEWVAVAVSASYLRWGDGINRNGSSQVAFRPTYEDPQKKVRASVGLLNDGEGSFNVDLAEIMLFEGTLGLYEAGLVQEYLIAKAKPLVDLQIDATLKAFSASIKTGSVSANISCESSVIPLHDPLDTSDLLHWYTATDPTDFNVSFGSTLFQWEDRAQDEKNDLVGVLPQEGNPVWKTNDIGIGNSVAFTKHNRSLSPFMVSLDEDFVDLISDQQGPSPVPQIPYPPPLPPKQPIPSGKNLTIMMLVLPDCAVGSRRLLTVGQGSFEQDPYSLRVWLNSNCDDKSKDDLVVELNGSYSRSDIYVDCRERNISPDPDRALYAKATYEQIRDRNRDPVLITLVLEEQNITAFVHDGGVSSYFTPDEIEGVGTWLPQKGGRIWIGSGNSSQTNDSKYAELIFWAKKIWQVERETIWDWIFGRYGLI